MDSHYYSYMNMMKLPFLPLVRPMRKCWAGKQNFTQVLPWVNYCSLSQVSHFFENPTLFCPNGLNDVLQNFLIGQSIFIFCIFFTNKKKWHMCKIIRRGHSMPVPLTSSSICCSYYETKGESWHYFS